MRKLFLIGKTQKGKNRIREHGSIWVVLNRTDKVLFEPKPGPWLFIAPPGKNHLDKASRWVHETSDPDFKVEEIPD